MFLRAAFAVAFMLALAAAPLPAAAERVGNVGAANPSAFGAPPRAARRALAVGAGVEGGERIDTSAEGSAQIIFNDTSTMMVGRNSVVVIDDFVYRGGSGSQSVSLTKGVMRFVGGAVSHGAGARVTTPTAFIGVRGGSALLRIGGDCGTLVVHQVGVIEVSGQGGGAQTLTRPGFGVCASDAGVSEPFRVPGETIAALTTRMASRSGQSGGAHATHANESAAALGDHAPASIDPSPGLSALAPVWAGEAIVQSRANANNQPAPAPPRAAPKSQQEAPPATPSKPSEPQSEEAPGSNATPATAQPIQSASQSVTKPEPQAAPQAVTQTAAQSAPQAAPQTATQAAPQAVAQTAEKAAPHAAPQASLPVVPLALPHPAQGASHADSGHEGSENDMHEGKD